jgi:hypothetical protein
MVIPIAGQFEQHYNAALKLNSILKKGKEKMP